MSIRVSLRGMLRLIRGDTLRKVHNAGFLVQRLMYCEIVNILINDFCCKCYQVFTQLSTVYIYIESRPQYTYWDSLR